MISAQEVRAIEAERNSTVIVLGATSLDTDILGPLYDILSRLEKPNRLDVVLQCRGGSVHAARRIALILNEFSQHLSFIVPHHCESAGTITILGAQEILAGPVAIFSPIDPLLESAKPENAAGPLGMSAQDVRLFKEMLQQWFGATKKGSSPDALAILADNIFPTTLTSLYRATLEVDAICIELLSLGTERSPQSSKAIADSLQYGFHSHGFPLTGGDLGKLGLPIINDTAVDPLAWRISQKLNDVLGRPQKVEKRGEWCDVVLGTHNHLNIRRRTEGGGKAWVAEALT